LEKAYGKLSNISFDKAVLEKSNRIRFVKGIFDWDDIGSLDALAKTFHADAGGNLVKGSHLEIDTSNSVIYSEEIPVATIGVDNMIIAAMKDTILICPRDRVQDIKLLVGLLKSYGYEHLI
jgi:mannose-1-phosphate guanylyltransferase